MSFAMDACIERAAIHGIAFAAVRGQTGYHGYYARRAAAHNMVGICATNALPTMAPLGGTDKLIGTQGPALPARKVATSYSIWRLEQRRTARSESLHKRVSPFLDIHGAATTDATAALEGLIAPIGAHKELG